MQDKFYVYVHRRNIDGSVFYVGKGKGGRAWIKTGRSKKWQNTANKNGFTVHIIVNKINEICAFSMERAIIKFYGKENLCNITDGGEGASGLCHSENTKAKLRGPRPNAKPWLKGKKVPEYLKIKLSDAKIGKNQSNAHAKKSRENKLGFKVFDTSKFNLDKRKSVTNTKGEVFDSANDAARQVSLMLGVNASQGNISMAANGHRRSAYGMGWSYVEGAENAAPE
jgi:hypothetical protein